jgi:hypothetical protein
MYSAGPGEEVFIFFYCESPIQGKYVICGRAYAIPSDNIAYMYDGTITKQHRETRPNIGAGAGV